MVLWRNLKPQALKAALAFLVRSRPSGRKPAPPPPKPPRKTEGKP